MSVLAEEISEAADFIRQHRALEPVVGLILGTGLGSLAEQISADAKIG